MQVLYLRTHEFYVFKPGAHWAQHAPGFLKSHSFRQCMCVYVSTPEAINN